MSSSSEPSLTAYKGPRYHSLLLVQLYQSVVTKKVKIKGGGGKNLVKKFRAISRLWRTPVYRGDMDARPLYFAQTG